ncbi:hypothetical protein V5799_022950 [Amblyomma americanum]|uniref:Uncharacterized protein n=1 Tax=Amblyomma americanum TaxID=6943 RepID=A0AAQ4FKJ0_AMBAM
MEDEDSEDESSTETFREPASDANPDAEENDNDGADNWTPVMQARARRRVKLEKAKEDKKARAAARKLQTPAGRDAATNWEKTSGKVPSRRKPPLPKTDVKVILRPKQGLPLKQYPQLLIEKAIQAATGHRPACGRESFIIKNRPGSNIIITSTLSNGTARQIKQIGQLSIRGVNYEVKT